MNQSLFYLYSRYKPQLEAWGVKVVALLTCVMGMVNLVSSVTPALKSRLLLIEDALPMEVRHGSRLAAALAGFALILLASSLWRRKRTAWILTVGILVLSSVLHLLKGLDYEEASYALFLLIPLILLHRSYYAPSDPPSIRQGLLVLIVAFGFTLVYGLVGFYLLNRHLRVNFSMIAVFQQIFGIFIFFNNPGLEPMSGFGKYISDSIYVIGISTIGYALLMLIRPVLAHKPVTIIERAMARTIVELYGKTSLSGLALLKDKSYFFSQGGSVIAYGVSGRGAVSIGDPIGPANDARDTIMAFHSYCLEHDWRPAFIGVQADYLEVYRAAGFDIICIGQEAIVPVRYFTLAGGENKDLRVPYNKLIRFGFTARYYSAPLTEQILQELRIVSEDWLAMQPGGENRFSVGWFDDEYVRKCPIMAIHSPSGTIVAFANILKAGPKRVTIDMMRRKADAPNGTMEFLFVSIIAWAREQDFDTFSLGICVGAGERKSFKDSRIERKIYQFTETLCRFYNFRGLHEFKKKFHPEWQPRFLVYSGATNLPMTISTIVRVHTGDNLLGWYLKKQSGLRFR